MVVRHLLHVFDQPVVGGQEVEAGAKAPMREDRIERLEFGQVFDLEFLQAPDAVLGLGDPLLVDLVPVLVVVAGTNGE